MSGVSLKKFVLPGFAAIVAASAALAATNEPTTTPAYANALTKLDADDYVRHANEVFSLADQDGSGTLDQDEHQALAIVQAELARLNGFVSISIDGEAATVALPDEAARELSEAERARIGAVATRQFFQAAGSDGALDRSEFASFEMERFLSADANRNGVLKSKELTRFATQLALAPSGKAASV
ncbi:MAG: hypothetical protein AAFR21_06600 [Pseudomonadota bacterium]